MPRLVRLLGRLGFRHWIKPFQKALDRPWESQQRCLLQILKRNKNTLYGKRHGFGEIHTPETYQQQVPVSTYDDMQSYFESISNGTPNVLFPDPTVCFLLTSGTTGQPKLLPLSNAGLADFQKQDMIIFGIILSGALRSDVFSAHLLTFSAPAILSQHKGRYPVGYITGVISTEVPTLYKYLNRIHPTRPVLNMTDWKTKLYKTALEVVGQDVRLMFGMPSNIVAFLRALVQDLAPHLLNDESTPKFVKYHLRRSMQDGELRLGKLWPEMRSLIYGGVHITPYLPFLHSHFDELYTRAIYWATEGALGLQFYDEGINPALSTVFFEFLPADRPSETRPLLLSDVKRNTTYHILVTTVGGFYRYDIGDLIKFTKLDPPTIEIVGRVGTVASIAGERLLEQQLVDALQSSCDITSASISAFTAVPIVTAERTGYDIYVEFIREPRNLSDFEAHFDKAIRQLNFGYHSERIADVLSIARFFTLPEGTLARLAEKNHPVQGAGKVPVISRPEMLQELRLGKD